MIIGVVHSCRICARPAYHEASPFCATCRRLRQRIDTRGPSDIAAWERALKVAWSPEVGAFRCYYSGVPLLTEGDHLHPRYLTREHRRPRDEQTVVTCAKAVNDLKGTADEKTFERRVRLLARVYQQGDELTGDDRILESLMHAGMTDAQRRSVVLALSGSFAGRPAEPRAFDGPF